MRPVVAALDSAALVHNFAQFPANSWAVVKANGYGLGAVGVAQRLPNAFGFAVASLEEGLELRQAGIQQPILLLEGVFEPGEWREVAAYQLDCVIHELRQLDWLEALSPRTLSGVWLKLDTGMHRLGLTEADAHKAAERLSSQQIQRRVWMTHYARADETGHPLPTVPAAPEGWLESFENSAATLLRAGGVKHFNRAGISLYGASPSAEKTAAELNLKPVVSLQSRVGALRLVPKGESVGYGYRWCAERDSLIATIPCGYADGYMRALPDGTPVAIDGEIFPLAGRVSMDRITVDVTDWASPRLDAPVELWGQKVAIDDIAARAGTISYELLCNMAPRVYRIWSSS